MFGMDMVGIIEVVGLEVGGDIKQGDVIMVRFDFMKFQGVLVEYVVFDEGMWVIVFGVDMNEVVGVVMVVLIVYQCIKLYVKEGDKVFFNGGGGGLGMVGI